MVGAFVIVIIVFMVAAATEFSPQDKHYLAAIHDPCAHSEVLASADCGTWGQEYWKWPDDHTLVSDAHAVCTAQSDARVGEKDVAGVNLLLARHPNYYDLQASVEQIVARNIYCPDVLYKP